MHFNKILCLLVFFVIRTICPMDVGNNNNLPSTNLHQMALQFILNPTQETQILPCANTIDNENQSQRAVNLRNKKSRLLDSTLLDRLRKNCSSPYKRRYYLKIINSTPMDEFKTLYDPKNGWTALHYAADASSLKFCQYLLKNGFEIDKPDNKGFYPHDIAQGQVTKNYLRARFREAHQTVEQNLLEKFRKGLEVNVCHRGEYYLELIQDASDADLLQLYDPDRGWTALHYAAYACTLKACKKLMDLGADVCKQDNQGMLPYQLAIGRGTQGLLFYAVADKKIAETKTN